MIKIIAFDTQLILQWWHFILLVVYFIAGLPTFIFFMNTVKNQFFVLLMSFVLWPLTAFLFGSYIFYSAFISPPPPKEQS